jgi:hypothetical protein
MFGQQRRANGLDVLLFRQPPSLWQQFWERPVVHLTHKLFSWRLSPITASQTTKDENAVAVVCIFDTHNTHPKLPNGDILIHAGDLTDGGTLSKL